MNSKTPSRFQYAAALIQNIVVLQLIIVALTSSAAPGDLDLSFDPGSGVNGTVNASVVQADGRILIGGEFNAVSALQRRRVARLDSDGTADSSFDPGAGFVGIIYSIALQADGKVLIAGSFGFNGLYDGSIARLNSDGTRDTNFHLPTTELSVSANVYSVALQSDGKILIGGEFARVDGTNRNGLARLNSDGTLDTSFVPDLPLFGTVRTIVPLSSGKILVGGWATATARLNVNGSRDMTFNMGTNGLGPANGPVYSMAVQADGKILLAGDFSAINGTNRSRVARLHANGSLDLSFNTGGEITNSGYTQMHSVAVQSDGKVLIGGEFDRVNGITRLGFARLNTNGTLDTTFEANTGPDTIFKPVNAITVQTDGKLLVGGAFVSIKGVVRSRIGRVNPDGTLDTSFDAGSGIDGQLKAIARQPDGKYIVGGQFSTVRGLARPSIARLNADGTGDSTFDPSSAICCAASINAVALQPDGKVVIGGSFYLNPTNRFMLARLNANGALDTGFQPVFDGSGDNNRRVAAIGVQPDGKILIGGDFSFVSGAYRPGIARLNTNGMPDLGFTPEITSENITLALLAQPDGKILVGGAYATYTDDGYFEDYFFLRLNSNGGFDRGFEGANGIPLYPASTRVNTIVLQPDSRILVGGYFAGTPIKGTNRHGIFRVNANGTLDTTFNPGTLDNSTVSSIALQPDGKILMGGSVGLIVDPGLRLIARLNANGSWDNSFNADVRDWSVASVVLQPDGNIVIGGWFTTVNGVFRPNMARLFNGWGALSLSIARSNGFVIVSWPSLSTGFSLQQATDLTAPSWSSPPESVTDNGTNKFIIVNPPSGNRFYRLFKP